MSAYRFDIEESFRTYYGALCYFASQYVWASDEEVEDLVQDCFVKLLERKPVFDSEDYLRNYLYVAVRNNCLNYIRQNKLRMQHADGALWAGEQLEEGSEEVFNAEVLRRLAQSIDHLPPQCRRVIHLSYVEGLDNESVAGAMGVSINTVRAQKMRGKRLLRLSLGKAML